MSESIKLPTNRNFGIVFFVLFFIIAFWSFRGEIQQIKILPFCLSLIFLILGLINSKLLTPLNKLWFKFGEFLGRIIAPIVIATVFFLVITPIAIFMRMAGKDLLKKKYDNKIKSYWINRVEKMNSMKKQF